MEVCVLMPPEVFGAEVPNELDCHLEKNNKMVVGLNGCLGGCIGKTQGSLLTSCCFF